MKKQEFEAWHKAGHSGIVQNVFFDYCKYIKHVETELGKDLEDYPIIKEGQCLDQIYKGSRFAKESEKDLVNYRSAVKKYWTFRRWKDKNSI
jgi:hypothetical protein